MRSFGLESGGGCPFVLPAVCWRFSTCRGRCRMSIAEGNCSRRNHTPASLTCTHASEFLFAPTFRFSITVTYFGTVISISEIHLGKFARAVNRSVRTHPMTPPKRSNGLFSGVTRPRVHFYRWARLHKSTTFPSFQRYLTLINYPRGFQSSRSPSRQCTRNILRSSCFPFTRIHLFSASHIQPSSRWHGVA